MKKVFESFLAGWPARVHVMQTPIAGVTVVSCDGEYFEIYDRTAPPGKRLAAYGLTRERAVESLVRLASSKLKAVGTFSTDVG